MALTTTQGWESSYIYGGRQEAVFISNCRESPPGSGNQVCTVACKVNDLSSTKYNFDSVRWGKRSEKSTPALRRTTKPYYTHRCEYYPVVSVEYSSPLPLPGVCMFKNWQGKPYRFKSVVTESALSTHPFLTTGSLYGYLPNLRRDTVQVNDMYKKLYDKLLDEKVNIGQELATLLQTSDMIMEIGLGVSKVLRCFRFNNLKKAYKTVRREMKHLYDSSSDLKKVYAKQFSKKASQSWLQLYYGVQPLVISTEGLIELATDTAARPLEFSVNVNKWNACEAPVPTGWFPVGDFRSSYDGVLADHVNTSWMFLKTYWKMLDPMSAFQKQIGFDWANISYIAYDLTKWSFLINWVVDIGSWLTEFRATRDVIYVDGCISHLCKAFRRTKRHVNTATREYGSEGYVKSVTFERVPLKTRPSPQAVVRNPFYNSFNYANAATLMLTNIGRR